MNTYAIDLTLRPTTFDLWHVCLAGTVLVLALLLITLLLAMVISLSRGSKKKPAEPVIQYVPAPAPEPVV